jgi:uncharacterized protein
LSELGIGGEAGSLEAWALAVLTAVAFLTSILSAVVGMAGGIVLLAVMLLFLPPLVAIPLHGAVQLVSNAARSWIQRRHVVPGIAWRFSLLLLPAGFAGIAVARELPPGTIRALIGAFVLVATWRPRWLVAWAHPERASSHRRFVALGGVVGALNVTVGATGPRLAPFFLNLGLSRMAVIGTQAACQTLGHSAKLVVYGVAGFAFHEYLLLFALLAGGVVVGTQVGSRILGRVSEVAFTRLYKVALTVISLHLLVSEAWKVMR